MWAHRQNRHKARAEQCPQCCLMVSGRPGVTPRGQGGNHLAAVAQAWVQLLPHIPGKPLPLLGSAEKELTGVCSKGLGAQPRGPGTWHGQENHPGLRPGDRGKPNVSALTTAHTRGRTLPLTLGPGTRREGQVLSTPAPWQGPRNHRAQSHQHHLGQQVLKKEPWVGLRGLPAPLLPAHPSTLLRPPEVP